jgi:hypothetical protein
VKDILKKAQLSTDEIPACTRKKLKSYDDLFIKHITNAITSVKKDDKQEDETSIMPKMKSLSLIRTEESDQ